MFPEVCPCKDCVPPKRNATCHSQCEEYLKWNAARQLWLDKVAAERHAEADYNSIQLTRNRRIRKYVNNPTNRY